MTAAGAAQSSLAPTSTSAPKVSTPSSQRSDQSSSSKTKRTPAAKDGKIPRGERQRPCDACRKRKSKCVREENEIPCQSCAVHNQPCQFNEDPQPRKRRLDHDGKEVDSAKRRSTLESHNINAAEIKASIKSEPEVSRTWVDLQGNVRPRSELLLGNPQHYGTHIGYTTELEPILFDIYKASGKSSQETGYQKPDPRNAFLVKKSDDDMQEDAESEALTLIESLIGAHGAFMIQSFRDNANRSFPIVEQPFFNAYNERQRNNIEPGLLAAMYIVAASSPIANFPSAHQLGIDLGQLEEIAYRWFENSLSKPTLSTIQTGILLMQRPTVDAKTLNSQLVSAAYELGLNLDCTPWALTDIERSMRKRLAWALYMQDKWCALVHGRPSLIPRSHWAVKDLVENDFLVDYEGVQDEAKEEMKRGRELFAQMVSLTEILSTILETFYTLQAMQEVEDKGEDGTRLILDRAKPVQIRLKDWFAKLPKGLKMDSSQTGKSSSIGHLHLAYFATEITLHRCIIRSLSEHNKDAYLSHVCRSAAKTRLISAMDFTNRLRPDHLTSFWYFPSKTNFALIGTFGSLLMATAPGQEEADFYRTRLAEFRWTLCVSSKNANFLNFAVESLDSNLHLLQALAPKPSTRDLSKQMPAPATTTRAPSAASSKPLPKVPPKPLQRPSPPQDDSTADIQPQPFENLQRTPSLTGRSNNMIRPQRSSTSLASHSGLVSPSASRTSSDQDVNHGSHESLRTGYSQHSGSASHSAQHSGSGASDFQQLPRSTSRMADPEKMLSKISEARSSMIREQEAQSIRNSQRSSAAHIQQQQRPSDVLQRQDSWPVPPQYDQPTMRNVSSQLQYARGGGEIPFAFPGNTAGGGGGGGGGGRSQYGGSISGIDSYYGGSQMGGYAESVMGGYGPGEVLAAQQHLAHQQAMQQQQQQGGRMWFIEGLHDDHLRM
ncbi:MAG: hypothetical protein L6R38_006747 [Xanthoria sp. 2 TBL-2021]|nr:MAG: hypothetical protein L6R38_006747 [Xanthoria sp. 2 TBL-2021]